MRQPAVYQRVLLKLSGEALMGRREYGLDTDMVNAIASDIKAVAAFLVSEASRHLTGQYVVLDGGAITTNYPTAEAFS